MDKIGYTNSRCFHVWEDAVKSGSTSTNLYFFSLCRAHGSMSGFGPKTPGYHTLFPVGRPYLIILSFRSTRFCPCTMQYPFLSPLLCPVLSKQKSGCLPPPNLPARDNTYARFCPRKGQVYPILSKKHPGIPDFVLCPKEIIPCRLT